jgi:hypothetical protein
MSEEKKKVLEMLAAGKITADEAERLLEKLEPVGHGHRERRRHRIRKQIHVADPGDGETLQDLEFGALKYLRVLVNSSDGDEVNIRVPLKLIRTGIKLSTVLPSDTSAKLAEKGIDLAELANLDGKELEEALRDLSVDVDSSDGDTVRIFCE